MRIGNDLVTKWVSCASGLVLLLCADTSRAADKADEGAPKAGEGKAAKPLCDQDWEGGFSTIVVDQQKYDGKAKVKAYDPQNPEGAWDILSDSYLRYKTDYGVVWLRRAIGRFYDNKSADAFLRKVYKDSKFSRYLNPHFPPNIEGPGALLVSEKYTCKLDRTNKAIDSADWIVEVDGHLFAGGVTACKQGKKKKTVTVVDCAGSKSLLTDTVEVSCEANVNTCLHPLPDQAFALDHVYSLPDEGTNVLVRAYDIKKKQRVFSVDENNEGGPETELLSIEDVDGDGVPEILHRVAETGKIVSKLKWRNRHFVKLAVQGEKTP
jgi:hypothetical protein